MRSAVSVIVAVLLLAVPAIAGGARVKSVSKPSDGKVVADLELVNDARHDQKFKVSARVICDKADGKGTSRGKKVKYSVRLGAGETLTDALDLPMPKKGGDNVRVECKVKWDKGRDEIEGLPTASGEQGNDDVRDDPVAPGDKPDLPPDWYENELLKLGGTLSLTDKGLLLDTEDGATWLLVGDEADLVAKLMKEAGKKSAEGIVVGTPLLLQTIDHPGMDKPGNDWNHGDKPDGKPGDKPDGKPGKPDGKKGKGLGNDFAPGDFGKVLFLLEWKVDGIKDTRPTYVHHRHVLKGLLCKIGEASERVVTDVDGWKTLLTDAGIRLPEKTEKPTDKPNDKSTDKPINGAGKAFPFDILIKGGIWGDDGFPGPDGDYGRMPWEVDFEKEMVVAIFAGEQLSTGFGVKVISVTKTDEGTLIVAYGIHSPSGKEVVVDVPTTPFAMIAIPASDAKIEFKLVEPTDEKPTDEKPTEK